MTCMEDTGGRRCGSAVRTSALFGILCANAALFSSAAHALERPEITGPAVFELSTGDSEVVALAGSLEESMVLVTAPGASCGGEGTPSFLSVLRHQKHAAEDIEELFTLELGMGEATSVAGNPSTGVAVVAVKDPHKPNVNPGKLLLLQGARVVRSLPVGPGPDSVAISPDGRFAVVACEAETPDDDDCEAEAPQEDAVGAIHVIALGKQAEDARTVAIVTGREIFERHFHRLQHRAARPEDIEPEFVAVAPCSTYALVSLQEQSAVAVVELAGPRNVRTAAGQGSPDGATRTRLLDVIFLPHEFSDQRGIVRGVHPDGLAISPDGTCAVTANESHSKARQLQGISILDLRNGPRGIKVAGTHSIFDLDKSLESPSREKVKVKRPKKAKVKIDPPPTKFPRLDPEGVAITSRGDSTLAAVAIERSKPGEESGSVLFLDISRLLDGGTPVKIDRRAVGSTAGARPETLEFTKDGRFLFVASERDGGTLSLFEIK